MITIDSKKVWIGEVLGDMDACWPAVDWVLTEEQLGQKDGKHVGFEQLWDICPRADWLAWVLRNILPSIRVHSILRDFDNTGLDLGEDMERSVRLALRGEGGLSEELIDPEDIQPEDANTFRAWLDARAKLPEISAAFAVFVRAHLRP